MGESGVCTMTSVDVILEKIENLRASFEDHKVSQRRYMQELTGHMKELAKEIRTNSDFRVDISDQVDDIKANTSFRLKATGILVLFSLLLTIFGGALVTVLWSS